MFGLISSPSLSTASIKCICFDLGGVLVHPNAPQSVFQNYRIQLPENWTEILQDIHEKMNICETGEETEESVLKYASEKLGFKHELAHEALMKFLGSEYLGAEALVTKLNKEGYHTGCITNTIPSHWSKLEQPKDYPGIALLQTKVVSFIAKMRKPDPKIYRLLEEKTNSKGDEIIFFDDRIENIDAALKLGWKAFLVNPRDKDKSTIDQVKDKLRECSIRGF